MAYRQYIAFRWISQEQLQLWAAEISEYFIYIKQIMQNLQIDF